MRAGTSFSAGEAEVVGRGPGALADALPVGAADGAGSGLDTCDGAIGGVDAVGSPVRGSFARAITDAVSDWGGAPPHALATSDASATVASARRPITSR